ncbi:hypothetical protein [Convivina intestini]|uniref:Uncharacterized protein n=1 Tax=Convivina intestini TaxID=1505726 RepID=A0A2U1DF20_9LACO|nr:hypothetical protein [Convivina intestini]PVY86268.1 hypothetical protein C7384_101183 [Convivina intestini]CAH1851128.1 hypothetical protein R077811_00230 [Convivina intestini]SDB82024.1 hypothetical protein SAMN05216341_101175 [Leuconostocaceae bacterium R-53105]
MDEEKQKNVSRLVVDFFAETSYKDLKTRKTEMEMLGPSIFSLVTSQSIQKTADTIKDQDTEQQLQIFKNLFKDLEMNQAWRIQQTLQDRLGVIRALENAQEQKEKEKTFENSLAKNAWLINPYWDNKRIDNQKITQQKYYKFSLPNNPNEKITGFSDILVYVSEESFPVIVEVKRETSTTYSTPNAMALIAQIDKYREGLFNAAPAHHKESHRAGEIKAVVVVGDEALEKWMDRNQLSKFDDNHIEVKTFNNLIENARSLYDNQFEIIDKENNNN